MIVEILPAAGIGKAAPLVLSANQIVIRLDDGTPIALAAVFGDDRQIAVGSLTHNATEFHRFLRSVGIRDTVIVQKLKMPAPPPGAHLVAGPDTVSNM